MVAELTKAIALLGGNQTPEQRQEWIGVAVEELEGYPWSLVFPAILQTRGRCRFSNHFVPDVIEAIADSVARLKAEQESIDRLITISEDHGE